MHNNFTKIVVSQRNLITDTESTGAFRHLITSSLLGNGQRISYAIVTVSNTVIQSPFSPMARVRGSPSKVAEKQATAKTGAQKKTPVKPARKRGRNDTPSPPQTTRSSRSQSHIRRPSVQLAKTNTDEHVRKRSSPMEVKDPFRPLPADISSDNLVETPVPKAKLPRNYWIANSGELSPPWIACSGFVPPAMIEFLMRCKKRTAISVKF